MKKFPALMMLAALLALGLSSCDNAAQKAADLAAKNKAVCMKSVDAMNNNNLAILDSIFDPKYVEHTPDPMVTDSGIAGLKQGYQMMIGAYPDVKIIVNNVAAEGDLVIIHQTFTGTNTGPMGEMPATGKAVKADGVDVFKCKEGKITEHWAVYDSFSMMLQLGMTVVPMDAMPADSAAVPGDSTTGGH